MKQKHLTEISNFFSKTSSQKDLKSLLAVLLTEKEQHDIALRIDILRLLEKRVPQRDIAQKLGVGIATVTRGSAAHKSAPATVTDLL